MTDSHQHVDVTAPPTPTEPQLPQELERIIFELAAHNDRDRTLPVLIQVAHRVRDWLQSIVYDTVLLTDHSFYRTSKCPLHHPPRFPSGSQTLYVRNLLMTSEHSGRAEAEPDWADLLPHCHNLQDFAIWGEDLPNTLSLLISAVRSPLRTISTRGLLRLSTLLTQLFPDGKVNFKHKIFQDLTYLEVLVYLDDPYRQWMEGNNYACLPNLRYLCISNMRADPLPMDISRKCLEECKTLEVLIFPECDEHIEDQASELLRMTRKIVNLDRTTQEVPEDRVVANSGVDNFTASWPHSWYKSAVGSSTGRHCDVWARSERIVQRRRWRRKLLSWDSMIDPDLDTNLGDWMLALNMY